MTNINPTPSWADVRQLETSEYATGGVKRYIKGFVRIASSPTAETLTVHDDIILTTGITDITSATDEK